jgi:flagellar biosynthesis/type III secretory pathway chaperone
MIGQRLQPLVALSNLLNREREQIESEIASAPNDEAQAALQERLREIDAKLERVRLQTGLVRNPEDQP